MSKKEENQFEELKDVALDVTDEVADESADSTEETATETAGEDVTEDAVETEASEEAAKEETAKEETEIVPDEELLALKDAQIAELNNKVLRNMAEFDNFRKRSIKEKSQMYESGAKEVLEKLLPVIDNFERAFDAATDEHKDDPFVKGIDMIYKQMLGVLDEIGVEEIEALNQPFDADLHHAVQHEHSDDHEDNTVVEVYQKGYMYKDTVLRYSMVKVVN